MQESKRQLAPDFQTWSEYYLARALTRPISCPRPFPVWNFSSYWAEFYVHGMVIHYLVKYLLSDTFFYMDTFYGPINFRINGVSVLKGLTLEKKEEAFCSDKENCL